MLSPVSVIRTMSAMLRARLPEALPLVPPKPRKENVWRRDGAVLVSRVRAEDDVNASVARSLELLGGLGRLIAPGDRVMLKPNFNSADPCPGSTDLAFLQAVIELLREAGARVVVGESSGPPFTTREIMTRMGAIALLEEMGVPLIIFNEHEYVAMETEGDELNRLVMPRSAYETDKIVYLPLMKTHRFARFTLSLKLSMGFIHPALRRGIHMSHLEEKVVEINLAWQPDLIIMDGRKSFVSGGPDRGVLAETGVILASGDLVAMDVEALKILTSYPADNRLDMDIWKFPQIRTALRHGLGSGEYQVVSK